MNKPRPLTPADVLDHLDARLAQSDTLEVASLHYDPTGMLVEDETGQRFWVSVKVAK